ncbi:MAG TPA: GNAT family N-acetyltransferase [Roseiflexaceae bacterium]|nr:GNAT family N-acetyltransferase [Roseiflexaceae bacterium]
MSSDALRVRHNPAKSRYELEVDGALALIEYRDAGGVRYYTHTEVPQALEGHGIGSLMAKTVLDEAQAENLTIVPLCPFVRGYIERHPQYKSLVKH